MKVAPTIILLFGHDQCLLETRQWVLQTRGYRVLSATTLAGIRTVRCSGTVELLLICHSISPAEREVAIGLAGLRWPGCRNLTLEPEPSRAPNGLLGQLLHTMDGPAKLISLVGSVIDPPPEARAS